MTNVDLHCHSNVSDGLLSPSEVVQRAAARGVDLLGLTDHDQLGGLDEASQTAQQLGIEFVHGVEVSVSWRGTTVHLVGLRIDPGDATLATGLAQVRSGRIRRAEAMGRSLAAAGIRDAFEGALRLADNAEMIGRAHFARHLVSIGAVSSVSQAFRRYLVPGKPGYVPHEWATLREALGWIRAAAGQAVLAHPGRYGLSGGAMHDLLGEFCAAGGAALEVVTSSHSHDQFRLFDALARAFGLRASRGSDFHAPDESADFGSLPEFTPRTAAIWDAWRP